MIFWLVHISILAFLSSIAFIRLRSTYKPLLFWSALAFKLIAGIGVGLLFHFYYGSGDSLVFFKKAIELSELSISDHFNEFIADGSYATNNHPRDLFFVKILSLFARITGHSYWITSLYLSFISFLASWFFVTAIIQIFPNVKNIAAIAFLFTPSVIFWSSGILKDTVSSIALIFLVTILLKIIYQKKNSILEMVLGLISIFILFNIKHYLFITYILFVGLFVSLHFLKTFKKKVKWVIAIGVMVIAVGSTQYIHPYLTVDKLPKTIFENNRTIAEKVLEENQVMIEINEPTWSAIAIATPEALLTGLLKPSIFDKTIPFGWIHRLENFTVLSLMVFSILLWIKERPKVDLTILVPAIACICLLATMLALSTPNFGSLVRYKNAFLPFLFLIVSILPNRYITSKTEE